jgi:hypothetical protein
MPSNVFNCFRLLSKELRLEKEGEKGGIIRLLAKDPEQTDLSSYLDSAQFLHLYEMLKIYFVSTLHVSCGKPAIDF